jgi:predicted glycosyltransferase
MDPRGRHALHSLAAHNPALTVIDFAREPARLVAGAGCLVAMAGYNTMCEALSFRKRALVVPRVSPRSEQLIRAERLRERGLVELLHPDALAPERISSWLADNFGRPARRGVDLGGLQRLRRLAGDLLRECAPSTWRPAGNSVASAAH